MARFSRLDVLNSMVNVGFVPLLYHPDPEVAVQVVQACVDGGARVMEFTNRGDHALEVFSTLIKHFAKHRPELILGVGTVIDAPTAALYIAHGANFVVAPSLNAEVARLCNRRKVAYVPGCSTPSEIGDAEELGAEIVKLFPGETIGGPAFVKSLLGPSPWTRTLITGGVEPTRESISGWISAGATAIGIGSGLFKKAWLETREYAAITAKTTDILGWIKEARGR